MARQKGILKVEGALGDLSFYSSVYGDIVRRKGGASREKIRRSPAFKNLRRHQAEFAGCAAAGKLLRQGWGIFTRQSKDHTLVWRVTKVMNQVKDKDSTSERGKRSVKKGLGYLEGRALLNGFDLNSKTPLKETLKAGVNIKNHRFYISGLQPSQQIVFPKGATRVSVTALISVVDFEKKKHEVFSDTRVLQRRAKKQDLVLAPPLAKAGGYVFYLLQLRFGQMINGVNCDLNEGNSLAILNVNLA